MTRQRSFKRFVRARMEKTGESYTAARRAVLAAAEQPDTSDAPALATSDEKIRARTGRGWEEWFDLLDSWHADQLPHKEIARKVAQELGIDPLVWAAQAVSVSYERARGLRVIGQRTNGFAITAAKTVAVPVELLYEAFLDGSRRRTWLADDRLRERTATAPKSARFDWGDGGTRVHVVFTPKGDDKSTATLEHARLADAAEADRMKTYWRTSLKELKATLEAGERDA